MRSCGTRIVRQASGRIESRPLSILDLDVRAAVIDHQLIHVQAMGERAAGAAQLMVTGPRRPLSSRDDGQPALGVGQVVERGQRQGEHRGNPDQMNEVTQFHSGPDIYTARRPDLRVSVKCSGAAAARAGAWKPGARSACATSTPTVTTGRRSRKPTPTE